MKIISKTTGETVATITTNHSMTLDEAIELVGEIHPDQQDENVQINGEWYYYEDLDIDYSEDEEKPSRRIRIYRSMGVLAHEKSPVYTCNAPANNTPGLYDELTVELPAGWTAYETETDTVIVSPDGDKYLSDEILRDYGDAPALVWYDGEAYRHKLLREVAAHA